MSDDLVDSINPTSGNTMMIDDPADNQLFTGKRRPPRNAVPVGYLAGEDGRHVTGTAQVIDKGEL